MELIELLTKPLFYPKQSFDLKQSQPFSHKNSNTNYITYLSLTITRVGEYAGNEIRLLHNLSIRAPHLTELDHPKTRA